MKRVFDRMESKRKDYLAIFDLDGTLFDTGEVNYVSYREALRPYGIELEHDYFIRKCNGKHYTEFLPMILENVEHMEMVHAAKKEVYGKNLEKARVNRHLFQMIKLLRKEYYTAIVTTASLRNSLDILRYFGYLELFDLLITQEDIKKAKPDPEGFLLAMQKLNKDAGHTLIFEDSEVGICAARASGASVIVVNKF